MRPFDTQMVGVSRGSTLYPVLAQVIPALETLVLESRARAILEKESLAGCKGQTYRLRKLFLLRHSRCKKISSELEGRTKQFEPSILAVHEQRYYKAVVESA